MHPQLAVIGQEIKLGGIIGLSVIKQIGPVLAAVMIAGRVGGAVSAEIGTMKVTEQVDALRVMGVDPLAYLVVPRVAACTLMVPLITLFGVALGIFGGWLVAVRGFGVDAGLYAQEQAQMIRGFDLFVGLSKGVVFGFLIGIIGCWKGFTCERGAAGVGRAATDAFVASFIAIIIANFFLAQFLNAAYELLGGKVSVF
jgi:phospholipid/cholesterol/gamma-HCH transport system permease protein